MAVIEWRKRYRKYKPLTVVKKCTACGEKRIKDAYHVICGECVKKTTKCAKCLVPADQWTKDAPVLKECDNKECELEEDEEDGEEEESDNFEE